MSLILNIDAALDTASVCLAKGEQILGLQENKNPKDHSAWLHSAIDIILKQSHVSITELDAVAVSIGPGSYTGLRIGLSTAKGLCYALEIPLITVGTLDMMALASKNDQAGFLCPMIDARRMEVFTAIFDLNLKPVLSPRALILDQNSFAEQLIDSKLLFSGNGSYKLKELIASPNAQFSTAETNASHLAYLSLSLFRNKEFASLAYAEPLYIKEFHSPDRKPSS